MPSLRVLRAGLAAGVLSLGACAAVGPALTSLAVAVGQDLLSSAAMNHTDRYAQQLDHLFVTMARELTRLPIQSATERGEVLSTAGYGGQAEGGYETTDGYDPSAGYDQSGAYDPSGSYDQTGAYEQAGSYEQAGAYDQSGAYDESAGSYESQDSYESQGSYEQPQTYDQSPGYETGNDYSSASNEDAYGNPQRPVAGYPGSNAISLSLALLKAQTDTYGRESLIPVNDGDVLVDGNGVPEQGDRLKFLFQANCQCYVYLVGVDTTGYVASVFPDPELAFGNPVTAGQQYQLPPADDWWGLDRNKGIEHIYVVVSRTPRGDIASAVQTLRRTPAGSGGGMDGQLVAVAEPYVRQTRGLVKVQSSGFSNTPGSTGANAAPIALQTFTTPKGADDLLMTRWFRHQ